MQPNVIDHLGAVARKVVRREWRGSPARVVVAQRTYDSDTADVWSAITDAERIGRWFMPISGDLRLGGRYKLERNAAGTIEECDPPRRLAVSWEYGGGIGWVIVTLKATNTDSTRLQLEHIAHEDAAFLGFWDMFGPGAVGVGWDLSMLGLAEHLSTGGAAAPRDEAVWFTTDEGRSFAEAASDAWCAASISFGTDPAVARETANRTTTFYASGGEGQVAEARG